MRREVKPQGPVGYLLESLHLQGAALDGNYAIRQWNQPPIGIIDAPFQHLPMMVMQMRTRIRTRSEEGCRQETEGLVEIDKIATQGSTKNLNEEDKMILDIVRTVSAWNRTAA